MFLYFSLSLFFSFPHSSLSKVNKNILKWGLIKIIKNKLRIVEGLHNSTLLICVKNLNHGEGSFPLWHVCSILLLHYSYNICTTWFSALSIFIALMLKSFFSLTKLMFLWQFSTVISKKGRKSSVRDPSFLQRFVYGSRISCFVCQIFSYKTIFVLVSIWLFWRLEPLKMCWKLPILRGTLSKSNTTSA